MDQGKFFLMYGVFPCVWSLTGFFAFFFMPLDLGGRRAMYGTPGISVAHWDVSFTLWQLL